MITQSFVVDLDGMLFLKKPSILKISLEESNSLKKICSFKLDCDNQNIYSKLTTIIGSNAENYNYPLYLLVQDTINGQNIDLILKVAELTKKIIEIGIYLKESYEETEYLRFLMEHCLQSFLK